MEELLIHVVFGLMVGFCGGYAGIGGAPILIFLYVNLLGYSQHIAQGTVLAMMLGTISIPGIWFMRDRVRDRLKPIIAGTLSYAAISYVGASIAYKFDSADLIVSKTECPFPAPRLTQKLSFFSSK